MALKAFAARFLQDTFSCEKDKDISSFKGKTLRCSVPRLARLEEANASSR